MCACHHKKYPFQKFPRQKNAYFFQYYIAKNNPFWCRPIFEASEKNIPFSQFASWFKHILFYNKFTKYAEHNLIQFLSFVKDTITENE